MLSELSSSLLDLAVTCCDEAASWLTTLYLQQSFLLLTILLIITCYVSFQTVSEKPWHYPRRTQLLAGIVVAYRVQKAAIFNRATPSELVWDGRSLRRFLLAELLRCRLEQGYFEMAQNTSKATLVTDDIIKHCEYLQCMPAIL